LSGDIASKSLLEKVKSWSWSEVRRWWS